MASANGFDNLLDGADNRRWSAAQTGEMAPIRRTGVKRDEPSAGNRQEGEGET
jgi:hypothetical protein